MEHKNICHTCLGTGEGSLKWCGRCRGVKYCSAACQKVDWPAHKSTCNIVAESEEGSSRSKMAIADTRMAMTNQIFMQVAAYLCQKWDTKKEVMVCIMYKSVGGIVEGEFVKVPRAVAGEVIRKDDLPTFKICYDFKDGTNQSFDTMVSVSKQQSGQALKFTGEKRGLVRFLVGPEFFMER